MKLSVLEDGVDETGQAKLGGVHLTVQVHPLDSSFSHPRKTSQTNNKYVFYINGKARGPYTPNSPTASADMTMHPLIPLSYLWIPLGMIIMKSCTARCIFPKRVPTPARHEASKTLVYQ